MGSSKYVNDPTIGGRARTNADATPREGVNPQDRAVAQPLPGKQVEEVRERTDASAEDKAEALTKHSKKGKTYREVHPANPSDKSKGAQPTNDSDLDAQDPLDIVDPPKKDFGAKVDRAYNRNQEFGPK